MNVSGSQMIIGLIIGVFILVILVLKTKTHPFMALIITSTVTGLIGGLTPVEVVSAIEDGFGVTLASSGIVIGFGVMLGRILEVSGASERLAYTFIKWLGKHREEWAMAATGYIISIPVFCDAAFVILTSLVKGIARSTKKSVITIGVALAVGLVVTHSTVPPTPGPLGVASIFKVDLGVMILWGLLISIPIVIVGVLYAQWLGKKIYQLPTEDGTGWERPEQPISLEEYYEIQEGKNLPSLFNAMMPIVLPIILIFLNTFISSLNIEGHFVEYVQLIGSPIIAIAIGVVSATFALMSNINKDQAIERMEDGIKDGGTILLVVGGGGALGHVVTESGAGDYIAESLAQTAIPLVLLPFVIASIVRIIQGNGTVAMITAAAISAPILSGTDVNMVLAALAATTGSLVFSYFNDSFFWVVNRMLGIKDVKEQILTWAIPTTITWFCAGVIIVGASFFV